jgi:hypothetical protein
MSQFRVTIGHSAAEVGPIGDDLADCDYGWYEAETPEAALSRALRDVDATREYDAPVLLSTSEGYGRSNGAVNGNGTADRSEWWYVADVDGRLCGIYTVAEAAQS